MTSGTQQTNADILSISFGLFSLSSLALKINQTRKKPYESLPSCTAISSNSKA